MLIMSIVIFILITVKPVIEYNGFENGITSALFTGIGFILAIDLFFNKKSFFTKVSGLITFFCIGLIPFGAYVLPSLIFQPEYLIAYIVGIICIVGIILCINFLPKKNAYGNEVFGKIIRFKRFLKTAEKPKLEALVANNPTYFYDILPYAYVLGLLNKWINKFETISISPPGWYDNSLTFDIQTFELVINNIMYIATNTMSSNT